MATFMNRRAPLLGFLLAICVLIAAAVAIRADEPQPFQHGHIVPFLTTNTHAYLAIKLPVIPSTLQRIDYEQSFDYLVSDGYVYRNGATITRFALTSEATEDGWLLLKLSKPCSPGEWQTDVGLVIVCPPKEGPGGVISACVNPNYGITPLFSGVPPELVRCPSGRRRATRK